MTKIEHNESTFTRTISTTGTVNLALETKTWGLGWEPGDKVEITVDLATKEITRIRKAPPKVEKTDA
jgi:hypothetical protein